MIRCLIALAIARLSFGSADVICSDSSPESKLLNSFDKLLEQENVKIYNGIRLKRKHNTGDNADNERNTSCVTKAELTSAISGKIAEFSRTRFLELDLSSLLPNGKDF